VRPEAVVNGIDVESIYEVPISFHREGLDQLVVDQLNIWTREPILDRWETIMDQIRNATERVTIGIVGKYVDHTDAYKSLHEALIHGGLAHGVKADLRYIDSEDIEKQGAGPLLDGVDGILVPGGFGNRGTEGKIAAVQYAREQSVPFFGICLGLQVAVIEFARHMCGLDSANSVEFDGDSQYPVIHLMAHQHKVTSKGGSMRLGSYPCALQTDTLASQVYETKEIDERHRHRYEVNNDYRTQMQEKGLVFSGLSPDNKLVEIIELPDHPWFLGCQFHPEFKSRPYAPHPLFAAFVGASVNQRNKG
jgi:CTP synthase